MPRIATQQPIPATKFQKQNIPGKHINANRVNETPEKRDKMPENNHPNPHVAVTGTFTTDGPIAITGTWHTTSTD